MEPLVGANLDPVRDLRDGTPVSITTALAECHRLAGPRLVIEAGCEIPRDTPEENLHALREYARGHRLDATAADRPFLRGHLAMRQSGCGRNAAF